LFVQRAQAVRPHWTLTPEHGPVVTQICARLGGLPLAIELAAARIALLNPPTLLARLEHCLHVLTTGARDLPPRQQTMRATVAWSYDLLPAGEQRLFRWLAVWSGGATLHAIEAVVEALHADPTEVLEQVEALVSKNLLVQDETNVGDERVGMLEVVRAYGREQLTAHGEVEAVQRAHAHVYCALAEQATVKLNGSGQATWFQRVDQDLNNFRAAMHVLLNNSAWEDAVRLTRALWRYWRVRGLHREARTWMEQVLGAVDLAPGGGLTRMRRAQALLIVGSMAMYAPGEYDLALQRCEESWSLCQGAGDTRTEAAVLLMLGVLYVGRSAYDRAQQVLEQSMALFQTIDEHWGAAFALSYLGMIPLMQGRHAEAVPYFEQGLALARAAGDDVATLYIEYVLGLAAKAQGDDTSALQHFAAGLQLAVAVRDVLNVGYFVRAIAEVGIRQGHTDAGRRVLDAAVMLLHTVGASMRHVADTTHRTVNDQVPAALDASQGTQPSSKQVLTMEQAVAAAYDLTDTILTHAQVDRQAARDTT
jgi:tetratricopeptide (TPR) repeat protein